MYALITGFEGSHSFLKRESCPRFFHSVLGFAISCCPLQLLLLLNWIFISYRFTFFCFLSPYFHFLFISRSSRLCIPPKFCLILKKFRECFTLWAQMYMLSGWHFEWGVGIIFFLGFFFFEMTHQWLKSLWIATGALRWKTHFSEWFQLFCSIVYVIGPYQVLQHRSELWNGEWRKIKPSVQYWLASIGWWFFFFFSFHCNFMQKKSHFLINVRFFLQFWQIRNRTKSTKHEARNANCLLP